MSSTPAPVVTVGPKGLRGWFFGFMLTMVFSAWFYADSFIKAVRAYQHGDGIGVTIALALVLTLALAPAGAVISFFLKSRDGITFSKIFLVLNPLAWWFVTWFIPVGFAFALIATVHSLGSWIYLDNSKRVHNTLIH